MRKIIPLTITVALLSLFSFVTIGEKEHDKRLVGVWKGFEVDKQYEGVEKHWIQQRFENGQYVIMFTSKQDCEITTFTEKGKWWTKDGEFFEQSTSSKDIDIYKYTVDNPMVVNFKNVVLLGKKDDTYVFSDYKMDLD